MTRRREIGPQTSRRAAREFAFRVLFESSQGGAKLEDTLNRAELSGGGDEAYPALGGEARTFARGLIEAYAARKDEVDDLLHRTIQGWSFSQMAQTDLNVLRLAATELLQPGAPRGAVIESAVRVARKFGGDESGRFVNGVLGSLVRALPSEKDGGESA